ncbi:MAG: YbaK/EbsC family protein [Chloroflexota bacterium]
MEKTLSMKLLEKRKVSFKIHSYPDTERDAEQIAVILEIDPKHVYKTLVVLRQKGKPILMMLAANRRLNLKKLAKGIGEKKLNMASHAEAEAKTKLKVGGISPLLLFNKGFDIYIDQLAADLPYVLVSAGRKGINLQVPTNDLVKVVNARYVDASDAA